jgi:hypothetical protein
MEKQVKSEMLNIQLYSESEYDDFSCPIFVANKCIIFDEVTNKNI